MYHFIVDFFCFLFVKPLIPLCPCNVRLSLDDWLAELAIKYMYDIISNDITIHVTVCCKYFITGSNTKFTEWSPTVCFHTDYVKMVPLS